MQISAAQSSFRPKLHCDVAYTALLCTIGLLKIGKIHTRISDPLFLAVADFLVE